MSEKFSAGGEDRKNNMVEMDANVGAIRQLLDRVGCQGLAEKWPSLVASHRSLAEIRLFMLYDRSLLEPVVLPSTGLSVDLVRVEAEQIANVVAIRGSTETAMRQSLIRASLGQHLFAIYHAGRPVAYDWMCVKPERVSGGVISVGDGEVYGTDAFTTERYRRHGLHRLVHSFWLKTAHEEGYRKAYTLANLRNSGVRILIEQLGWNAKALYMILPQGSGGWQQTLRLWGDLYPFVPFNSLAEAAA